MLLLALHTQPLLRPHQHSHVLVPPASLPRGRHSIRGDILVGTQQASCAAVLQEQQAPARPQHASSLRQARSGLLVGQHAQADCVHHRVEAGGSERKSRSVCKLQAEWERGCGGAQVQRSCTARGGLQHASREIHGYAAGAVS